MNNNCIGIFDSGYGGLTILEKLKEVMPNENYLYYADSKNCPYGDKDVDDLINITTNIVEYLIKNNAKIIVIACNTATVKCMKYLREKYKNINFIGTVPAIKVALDNNYQNTLVMATPGTIKSERTFELINDNIRKNQKIYLEACPTLAEAIENKKWDNVDNIIYEIYNKYIDKNIDSIVLGCTHYPFATKYINKYFKDIICIDGSLGVSNYTKKVLSDNNLLTDRNYKGNIKIINSNDLGE